LYKKSVDRLALNASTQIKNGIYMFLSLLSREYVGPKKPAMPENPSENDQRLWATRWLTY